MITATVNDRTYKLGEFYRYPVFTGATDTIEFYVDMENKDQGDFIDFIRSNRVDIMFNVTLPGKADYGIKAKIFDYNIFRKHTESMHHELKIGPS